MRSKLARITFAALLSIAVNSQVSQAQAQIGPRVGYNFDTRDAFFSLAMTAPVSNRLSFYPSVDVYRPETGSRMGYNADLRVSVPTSPGTELYTGGGLNIMNRNVANQSTTNAGANLFAGLQGKSGTVHPFAEARVLLHNRSSFQVSGGVNFSIGGR